MGVKNSWFCLLSIIIVINCVLFIESAPVIESEENPTDGNNNSTEDLYVIRAIVYEVGILTDGDNSSEVSNETHEEVDLTFFDPHYNGSMIDLSNIPLPLQTNISGQVITGLAPVNAFETLQLPAIAGNDSSGLRTTISTDNLTIPSALVSVTTNVSTTNQETGSQILSELPTLLGLPTRK